MASDERFVAADAGADCGVAPSTPKLPSWHAHTPMTQFPCPLQQVDASPAREHPKQPCHSLNHLCWLVSRKRRLLADLSGRKDRLGASRIPESHLTVSLFRRSRAVLKHQRERSSVCPVPLTRTGNCEAQVPSRRKWEQHAACALLATPAEASLAKSHVDVGSMASTRKPETRNMKTRL